MLCITRRQDESLILETPAGEIIRVMVVEVRGSKVRIGVDAPRGVRVGRKEIVDANKRSAALSEAKRHAAAQG